MTKTDELKAEIERCQKLIDQYRLISRLADVDYVRNERLQLAVKLGSAQGDLDNLKDHRTCFGSRDGSEPRCKYCQAYVNWWCTNKVVNTEYRNYWPNKYNCPEYEPISKAETYFNWPFLGY